MIGQAEKLGRYTIVGDLGVGGMGSVRLGRSDTGRLVVLKCALHSEKDLEQRLIDEARVGFRLNHPHIVETLDLFYDDGHPVLVIAYVSGGSLFELRRRRPLAVPTVARIGRQVAAALHSIHTATDDEGRHLAVVHRDVTPANIMVGHDGDARLIDLGIARSAESAASKTATGFLRGTLRYLAPELFADSIHSPSTDIWSLGLCILEAALGRRAILGGDAEAVGKIVAWNGIRLQPGERLDPRLHDILHVLLQRDPAKRVSDAAQAAQMFERLEKQFAGSQRIAADTVAEIMGPPRDLPRFDPDSTELFVREAASTFCGAPSGFADLATAFDGTAHDLESDTEGFENVYVVDPNAPSPSLGDLYQTHHTSPQRPSAQAAAQAGSSNLDDSRAKLATPSRMPANDDDDAQPLALPPGFEAEVETIVLLDEDDFILSDDKNVASPALEHPSPSLLAAVDAFGFADDTESNGNAALPPGQAALGPTAQPPTEAAVQKRIDDALAHWPAPPDATLNDEPARLMASDEERDASVVEGQLLTPSRPVKVAASGEVLPATPASPRARMARECGFPEPPPTPADALRDYVESLRGLEVVDDDAHSKN